MKLFLALVGLPHSCQEAKAAGAKYYFTNKPCKNDHLSARFSNTRKCIECSRINNRRRHGIKKQERNARCKAYYQDNKGRAREQNKRYLQNNKRRRREYLRQYYAENRSHLLAASLVWQSTHPENVRIRNQNRKARKRGAVGLYTVDDIARIRKLQNDKCACCRTPLKKGGHVDHIIALFNGGSNYPSNLQLLCPFCNISKRSRDPIEFMQANGRLL